MDYEKLYKEALDNLNRIKNESPEWWREHEKTMQEIFPGFFETKDERIRKELIEYIKDQQSSFISAPDCRDKYEEEENNKYNSWIAWLEKQGEQKPVNRLKTTAGNWYVCDMEVMNENMTTAFHRGEVYYCPKDGYIDVNGALFEVGTLDVFRLATKEEIPQQKQEWSEEDKAIIDYLLQLINNSHKEPCTKGLIAFGAEAWLKSIKDKVQPKQEWSEEDENRFNNLIFLVECSDENETTKEGFIKFINKLKSLRPQSQWKPSDEQMECLSEAIQEQK